MNLKRILFAGSVAMLAAAGAACNSGSKNAVYPGTDLEPNGNPIFTDAWTSDPAPLVVGDRVYVYTGEVVVL